MNRGPELLAPLSPGPKKIRKELKEYATSEKLTKPLALAAITPLSRPRSRPSRPHCPHLRSQHFGLPVLALGSRQRELRAPRLLLNQGPSEPCYDTEPYIKFYSVWSSSSECSTEGEVCYLRLPWFITGHAWQRLQPALGQTVMSGTAQAGI